MSADEILNYLRDRHASRALAQVLRDRALDDTCAANFGLTWRTRRLTADPAGAGMSCEDGFAVVLAVPKLPLRNLLPIRSEEVWRWMKAPQRRYAPLADRAFPPGELRATGGGIAVQRTLHEETGQVGTYLYVERSGIVELGMGYEVFRNRQTDRGFLLTPLVGRVWQLLGFVVDLFTDYSLPHGFILILALRGTQNALLGGLAEGWRSPWDSFEPYRPRCFQPNIALQWPDLSRDMTEAQIEAVVHEVAVEIEAAWGHGGPSSPPRCFVHGRDERNGQFDACEFASLVS